MGRSALLWLGTAGVRVDGAGMRVALRGGGMPELVPAVADETADAEPDVPVPAPVLEASALAAAAGLLIVIEVDGNDGWPRQHCHCAAANIRNI